MKPTNKPTSDLIDRQVTALVNKWILWLKNQKGLSFNTQKAYNIDLNIFFNFIYKHKGIGRISLDLLNDLELVDFRSWLSSLSVGPPIRSIKTVARYRASLSSFITFANNKEFLNNNKIIMLNKQKIPKNLARPLSSKQVLQIVDYIEAGNDDWLNSRNKAIIFLLWGCGLRIKEALNLNFEHIINDQIIVQGKGNKQRLIPLMKEVKKILYIWLSKRKNTKDIEPLFIGRRGNRLSPRTIQILIANIRKKLNLDDNVTPHSFRHSFATHLIEEGVDLRTLQTLLGHSNITTTQHYTKISNIFAEKIYKKTHPRSKL